MNQDLHLNQSRKIDPDPFTIAGAIAGVAGAVIGGIALWQSRDLPPQVIRQRARRSLGNIEEHLRHLRADLEAIQAIFSRADYPKGNALRLGNSAYIAIEDFERYVRLSDHVFDHLKSINKDTLELERLSSKVPWIPEQESARFVDESTHRLQAILNGRDFTVSQGLNVLQDVIRKTEDYCEYLQKHLRAPGDA